MKNQKIPKNPIDRAEAGLCQMLSLFNISVKKNLDLLPNKIKPLGENDRESHVAFPGERVCIFG